MSGPALAPFSPPLGSDPRNVHTSPTGGKHRELTPLPLVALQRLLWGLWSERGIAPRLRRSTYCIEFSPSMLPSVSMHRLTHPNCPMENLGRKTLPPAATTRSCSTAQSATLK